MRNYFLFFYFLFFYFLQVSSQENRTILWDGIIDICANDTLVSLLDFQNSTYNNSISSNNLYFEKIPVSNSNVEFQIKDISYIDVLDSELEHIVLDEITNHLIYDYYIATEKKESYLVFYIIPFVHNNNSIQKISEFTIEIIETDLEREDVKKRKSISNSVLSTGNWYKIGVTETGLHKIDSDFLISMGIDISTINPDYIRIFGNKAGMLNEGLAIMGEPQFEIDDLSELSIQVFNYGSDTFGLDDYILFFGESPHIWDYEENQFIYKKNIYTDTTYYFLSFDHSLFGKRIEELPHNYALGDPQNSPINSSDVYFSHEEDNVNLVKTGRQWFGESFAFDYIQDFETPIEGWDADSILFTANFAARSSITSFFEIKNGSYNIGSVYIPSVSLSSNDYYKSTFIEQEFYNPNIASTISLVFNNNGNSSALAWLDYFTLQGRKQGGFSVSPNSHYLFRDTKSVFEGAESCFELSKNSNSYSFSVFDVTDPLNVKKQLYAMEDLYGRFKTNTSYLKEFLVVAENQFFTPYPVGLIANQNIHGASQPNYIIVTHPKFIDAANRLATYHRDVNNENVLLVTTDQVYNEFSTGSQDVSAIRNMVKLFYDRAENIEQIPKNLLLFGDASFDYKNKLNAISNYVPTYESYSSSNIELSYCTDDYFVVVDAGEGDWNGGLNNAINTDLIDVGIGRIPVTSITDAEAYVDKVLNYNSVSSRGEWKNNICFVADDVDVAWEDVLVEQADALAEKIDTLYPEFNINKIYIDSYEQSLSLGSQRYPAAQADLVNLIQEGVLIVNYVGHGGEVGWASERILELSDINNFTNINRLPIFITATCEFTRYDDPTRVSAGEYLLLNKDGGAIGLYSTSRTVQASPTYNLVNALYNYLPDKNKNLTFGECLTKSKNEPMLGFSSIKRKFSFFGDPNLKLPKFNFDINTESVELLDSLGQVISNTNFSIDNTSTMDTLKSLSHVRVSGNITSISDNEFQNEDVQDNFSGQLYMTVFDKPSLHATLNNDGLLKEPFNYSLQNSVIYNGKVDIINGLWTFEFIVPKDINYEYGDGKISYYATDSILGEANGVDNDLVIGGISNFAAIDLNGPQIQLFMNDTNFVSGGYTNNEPQLLALLFDESGINTIGTGIGHDLTAILDGDTWNQYILNDYYESDFNTFQSGKVIYPFSDLSDGEHTLNLKAWDVYNNSNDMTINFFVTSSSELALEHLINYPNPSSTFTRFVFEHNRAGENLDIRVDIFSLNGQLVKSLSSSVFATGFRDESVFWDIDPSIDPGIYLYRLSVKSKNDNSISEKTEKLIIVR